MVVLLSFISNIILICTMSSKPKQDQKDQKDQKKNAVVSRLFRMKENSRVVTVKYEYDRDSKTLRYGATIFRREHPKDNFTKKDHRQTAIDRFTKRPVVLSNFEDNEKTIPDFHKKIRKQLFEHKVKGNRINA